MASAKNDDGTWAYPQVRVELEIIKNKHADELFYMEHRAVLAEDSVDSLVVELMVAKMSCEKQWYDNLEIGILAGTALAIATAWGVGQVTK